MAKFHCVCNAEIQMSGSIPNELEWKTLSDVEFDRVEGLVDSEEIYVASRSMFRRPTCDRLWIFWHGMDEALKCYKPEALKESGESEK
jgi:hypothetical protein